MPDHFRGARVVESRLPFFVGCKVGLSDTQRPEWVKIPRLRIDHTRPICSKERKSLASALDGKFVPGWRLTNSIAYFVSLSLALALRVMILVNSSVPIANALVEPGEDFAFNPPNATRSELNALGKAPGFFEPIDVRGRIQD